MIREQFRDLYLTIAGLLGRPKPGVYILNGHFISRKANSHKPFVSLLKKLRNYSEFVNLDTAINLISKKETDSETLVAFTFDDGFEECYTKIAPILSDYSVSGAYFINPGIINMNLSQQNFFAEETLLSPGKRFMSWRQIKELSETGSIIGNHTLSHKRLSCLIYDEVYYEVIEAKKIIEEQLKNSCDYFAYPYGQLTDFNEITLKVVKGNHKYIFSGADYRHYYSFRGNVLNRRHFEGDWPFIHLKYFLSKSRKY